MVFITITRVLDAQRETVWKAWTEPWRVRRWWGPKAYTTPVSEIDLRVGGKMLTCMRGLDGKDIWGTGEFLEVDRPARLVMTDSFADEKGNVVPATHYGFDNYFPMELMVTVTLDDLGDKTRLVLTHSGSGEIDPNMRDGMEQGWNEMFDKLEAFLRSSSRTRILAEPGSLDIVSTRTFDAPRYLVFQVMNDPALIPRWWGPRRFMTRVDRMDPRPGGTWRFVQRDADGNEYGFHGEYQEFMPLTRVIQTFEFEGMPGHVAVDTTTFEDRGGKTLVTTVSSFPTVEDRDGLLETGAEEGSIESDDRIDELLADVERGAVICTKTGCSAST